MTLNQRAIHSSNPDKIQGQVSGWGMGEFNRTGSHCGFHKKSRRHLRGRRPV